MKLILLITTRNTPCGCIPVYRGGTTLSVILYLYIYIYKEDNCETEPADSQEILQENFVCVLISKTLTQHEIVSHGKEQKKSQFQKYVLAQTFC